MIINHCWETITTITKKEINKLLFVGKKVDVDDRNPLGRPYPKGPDLSVFRPPEYLPNNCQIFNQKS